MEGENIHITKSNHTDSLPDTQPNTRRNTTIQALDTVRVIDILESLTNSQVLRPIRVLRLALHLDADNLDRLIPSRQPTTKAAGQNLLEAAQSLPVILPGDVPDSGFRKTGQTEARAPVGGLADGDCVDAPVDAADTFAAVDVHKGSEGAGGFDARGGHFMFCDFDGFHAGAEAHCGIGLGDAAGHAAADSSEEVVGAEGFGVVFCLGRYEEEDGAFGGSLNPGPGNETLVVFREIDVSFYFF